MSPFYVIISYNHGYLFTILSCNFLKSNLQSINHSFFCLLYKQIKSLQVRFLENIQLNVASQLPD